MKHSSAQEDSCASDDRTSSNLAGIGARSNGMLDDLHGNLFDSEPKHQGAEGRAAWIERVDASDVPLSGHERSGGTFPAHRCVHLCRGRASRGMTRGAFPPQGHPTCPRAAGPETRSRGRYDTAVAALHTPPAGSLPARLRVRLDGCAMEEPMLLMGAPMQQHSVCCSSGWCDSPAHAVHACSRLRVRQPTLSTARAEISGRDRRFMDF